MEIKKIFTKSGQFIYNRFIEVIGITISIFSILLFISLLTYSPEDPNFIISEVKEINNVLGTKGSYVSDLFVQSIGMISILVSFSFLFTGINVVRNKKVIILLQNTFFIIAYILFGSLFLALYYPDAFRFSINGNGGFVGSYLNDSAIILLVEINKKISFYVLIFLTLCFFLMSINFNIKMLLNIFKKIKFKNTNQSKNEVSEQNEYIKEINDEPETTLIISEVLGCMNPNANNYNSDATIDNGSCDFTFDVTWQVSNDETANLNYNANKKTWPAESCGS